MPLWPKNGKKPRAFIVWRANYLNQAKGNEILESSLWKDLDLIVDINYRMDTMALYSDVVLPASSYYEKVDINSTDCHSYIHPFGKACEPLFESKTDWDVFHALAQKIAEVAKAKGLKPYHGEAFDWNRDFTQLAHDWTGKGKIQTDEQAVNFILANAEETKGHGLSAPAAAAAALQGNRPRIMEQSNRSWRRLHPFQVPGRG